MKGNETVSSADVREIMERFSEPFARALAVFVKDVMSTDAHEKATTDEDWVGLSEAELKQQLAETIEEHERLAKTGDLESITVDDDAISRAVTTRIRWVMNERGVSQTQVAKRIGVSPAVISRVLKNPGKSKVETIRKIAAALDIELRDLL